MCDKIVKTTKEKNMAQNTGYTHNKKTIRLNLEDTKQTALIFSFRLANSLILITFFFE